MLTVKKNLVYLLICSKMIFRGVRTGDRTGDRDITGLMETYWLETKDCLPENTSSTLKCIPFHCFNHIKVCLRVIGTYLVTIFTCERSFRPLRLLKTMPEVPWFNKY